MTGMSGPGASGNETPRPFPSGYPANAPEGQASPASAGAAYPDRLETPPPAPPAAPARSARVVHARGPRAVRRRADRDATGRFQGLVTAIGLALGLLMVAGGGLLNASTAMPGVDAPATASATLTGQGITPTAPLTGALTPGVFVTTTATAQLSPTVGTVATATATPASTATPTTGTATPTPTATPVPAKLTISPPSVNNATCAASSSLATLTLSNPGASGNGLNWTAKVDSTNSANVTLSTTSDGTIPITSGQLNGGDTDTVYIYAGGGTVQSPVTVSFSTMPTSAGPVTVTLTCA